MKHELAAFDEVISSAAYFLPSYDARSASLMVASLRRARHSAATQPKPAPPLLSPLTRRQAVAMTPAAVPAPPLPQCARSNIHPAVASARFAPTFFPHREGIVAAEAELLPRRKFAFSKKAAPAAAQPPPPPPPLPPPQSQSAQVAVCAAVAEIGPGLRDRSHSLSASFPLPIRSLSAPYPLPSRSLSASCPLPIRFYPLPTRSLSAPNPLPVMLPARIPPSAHRTPLPPTAPCPRRCCMACYSLSAAHWPRCLRAPSARHRCSTRRVTPSPPLLHRHRRCCTRHGCVAVARAPVARHRCRTRGATCSDFGPRPWQDGRRAFGPRIRPDRRQRRLHAGAPYRRGALLLLLALSVECNNNYCFIGLKWRCAQAPPPALRRLRCVRALPAQGAPTARTH